MISSADNRYHVKNNECSESDPDTSEHQDLNALTVSTVISDVTFKGLDDSSFRKSLKILSGEDNLDVEQDTEGKNRKKKSLLKRIPYLGYVFVVIKCLIYSVHSLGVKELNLDPNLIVFYRSFLMFTMSIPWTIAVDKPPFPTNTKFMVHGLIFLRGIISFSGALADTFCVKKLLLGDFQMISALMPIFVSLSGRIFLKESFGKWEISSFLVMLSGVMCVVKPPFLFSSSSDSSHDNTFWLAAGVLVASKALQSNSLIILRHLRGQHIASLTANREIVFIILGFFVIMIANIQFYNPSTESKLTLLGLAVAIMVSSNLNLLALKLEEANKLSMVDRSLGIITAVLLDYYLLGAVPDYLSIIGIGLIIIALVIIGCKQIFIRRKHKLLVQIIDDENNCDFKN